VKEGLVVTRPLGKNPTRAFFTSEARTPASRPRERRRQIREARKAKKAVTQKTEESANRFNFFTQQLGSFAAQDRYAGGTSAKGKEERRGQLGKGVARGTALRPRGGRLGIVIDLRDDPLYAGSLKGRARADTRDRSTRWFTLQGGRPGWLTKWRSCVCTAEQSID